MPTIIGAVGREPADAAVALEKMLHASIPHSVLPCYVAFNGEIRECSTIDELTELPITATAAAAVGPIHAGSSIDKCAVSDGDRCLLVDGRFPALSQLLSLVAPLYPADPVEVAQNLIDVCDNGGAVVLATKQGALVTRDPVGVKPLYVAHNGRRIGFASHMKFLQSAGFSNGKLLPPGHCAHIAGDSLAVFPVRVLTPKPPTLYDSQSAVTSLSSTVKEVCSKAVRDTGDAGELGVLFSGGVDSSLLCVMFDKLGFKVTPYTVGVEEAPDIERATAAAELLGFPVRIETVKLEEAESYIRMAVSMTDSLDPMDISLATPLLIGSKRMRHDGCFLCVTGQGADELHGGYARYQRVLARDGYGGLHDALWQDALRLGWVGLPRDDAAIRCSGVEMVSPYLSLPHFTLAMDIAPELKLHDANDSLRKRVLRHTAVACGVPTELAMQPKKALQYGSGMHKALMTLSRRKALSPVEYLMKLRDGE